MEGYLTIGEISKFTGVPISTLRYYDSEGIISPIYKDTKSNYRYYSEMQIPVLRIIYYLKRLGFSNDSIKSHLKTLNYSHTLDTKSNYRYYSEMQIPVLRIIYYLKRLGFSNDSIKSHLKTLNYSHTLDLISQLIFDTKEEIKKLQKLHKELVKNSEQIKNLISIEEKINSFFIEESEKIKAIYVTIAESNDEEKFIKAAFKKLSLYTLNTEKELLPIGVCALTIPQENIENKSYRETKLLYMKDIKEFKEKITLLYTLNTEKELLPIGVCALTIPQENIENKSYRETKLLYMKDIKEFKEKITLPKRKYACMYCKGSLLNKKENIDKLLAWIEDNKLTKSEGDILLHFLAGPGFIKNPTLKR